MNIQKYAKGGFIFLVLFTGLGIVTYVAKSGGTRGHLVTRLVGTSKIQVNLRGRGQSLLRALSNEASGLFSVRQGANLHEFSNEVSNVSSKYGTCHHGSSMIRLIDKPQEFVYFTGNYSSDKEPAKSALSENSAKKFCDDKIVSYQNRFSIMHEVVMFPREHSDNDVIGGEQVIKVLNQQVQKEHYQFRHGFLKIQCSPNAAKLGPSETANKWLKTVKFEENEIKAANLERNKKYVIAIERGDYANLHNWARGIFNTFLMMIKFNIQPNEMSVLFLDAHPFSALDHAWSEIFGPVQRVGHLQHPIFFKNLIFTFKESDGPVSDYHHKSIGDTEEYRAFVLSRHGINSNGAQLSCPKIKITIIIRRNAVYHPRNTEGKVGRKIFNEPELIQALMNAFPDACVQAIMMEALPFHLQLEIISQTDLLIGMHGAGMSHTLFLPQHAAVLELFSKGFKLGRPWFECYQGIARWRGLKYDTWENFDPSTEMPYDYTIVPPDIVVQKSRGLIEQLCT